MSELADDLNNLVMSEQVQPLFDGVKKHITENVEPITEEFFALNKEKDDRWSWHPRQLELLDGAKTKAKESGLWNFFLPDAETGEGLAAPRPSAEPPSACRKRKTTMASIERASAQARLASVNSTSPTSSSGLRPQRSASGP